MQFPAVRRERVKDNVEDSAMMSLLMEAVIIAFSLGAVIGGVVAMHLMHPRNEAAKLAERDRRPALER